MENAIICTDVLALAKTMRDEAMLKDKPFLDAIAQVGGVIVPDMVWNGKRGAHGEYELAGEYADVPRRWLAVPEHGARTTFRGMRLEGNADEVAATIRGNGFEVTDDDVRDFLRTYKKPGLRRFVDEALGMMAASGAPMTEQRVETMGEMLERLGFESVGNETTSFGAIWPRYEHPDFGIEVAIGRVNTCVHRALLPANLRRTTTGWIILKTRDVKAAEIALASALVNATLAA